MVLFVCAAGSLCADTFELAAGNAAGVEVSFRLPAWSLEPVESADGVFYRINSPEGEYLLSAGYPDLPQFKVTVAVPPGVVLTSGWNVVASRTVNSANLLPVQMVQTGERERPLATGYADTLLADGGYFPVQVEVNGPMRLRDYTVAEIIVRPFAWDMRSGTIRVTESLRVSLSFSGGSALQATAALPTEKIFEPLYRNILLNYQQASGWKSQPERQGSLLASSGPFDTGGEWAEVRIDSSGMYAITGAELEQAGVISGQIETATLKLYTGGNGMLDANQVGAEPELNEVAITVEDGGDGRLDSNDKILFYGLATDRFTISSTGAVSYERHRYENNAAYWLNWSSGTGEGRRIITTPGEDAGGDDHDTVAERWLHFEGNTEYLALEKFSGGPVVNPAPDYWGWVLDQDQSGLISRSFSLPAEPAGGEHFMRLQIYGRGSQLPDSWNATVNGNALASGTNRNVQAFSSGWLPVQSGSLNQMNNDFTLAARGQYLGWYELRTELPLALENNTQFEFHQRMRISPSFSFGVAAPGDLVLYEVTYPESPVAYLKDNNNVFHPYMSHPDNPDQLRSFVAVAGEGYRRPVALRRYQSAGLKAFGGAQYLVIAPRELAAQAAELASMRQQRFSTRVVNVEDIYAEFSLGAADPAAVRNFLYYAYNNWTVRPQVVVFFGDGHVDFRGVTTVGAGRANYLLPWVTEKDIAIEEWFTRFDSTGLPQLASGRIPVKNAAEARIVLEKISAYEQGRDAGEWSRRVLLVADDGYVLGRSCDIVQNHVPGSELIDSLLPDALVTRKIYLDSYAFDPPEIGTRKPEANQDLLAWWNRGALLVNYLGHGSNLHWAQERVFDGERDVALLGNGYRLPLVLNSSCSIGHFDDYSQEAMAERILLKSGGGAIAVFAGTRVTFAFQNQAQNFSFVKYLFAEESLPLGLIHLWSRWDTAAGDRGNAERYMILGDPALILHRPTRELVLSPAGGQQVVPGAKVDFNGTVNSPGAGVDGGFSGVVRVKFLLTGQPVDIAYQCNGSSGQLNRVVAFERTPAVLFDGPVTVAGGAFTGSFVLPVSLAGELPADTLQGAQGVFVAYATSEAADAAGAGDRIPMPLTGVALNDTAAPSIRVLSAGRELADGDRVNQGEPLTLVVSDQSGINTTGRPGEQMTVEVDGGATWSADLTGLFSYNRDSYQEGTTEILLNRVPEGLHSFRFRAVDNALNVSRLELMLNVSRSAGALVLSEVVNYPNPFSEKTSICFELNQPAEVLIRIFTVAGRPVRQLRTYAPTAGFHTVDWHGTDEYKQKVANGVYLYKITCKSAVDIKSLQEVEAVGKALLSR